MNASTGHQAVCSIVQPQEGDRQTERQTQDTGKQVDRLIDRERAEKQKRKKSRYCTSSHYF